MHMLYEMVQHTAGPVRAGEAARSIFRPVHINEANNNDNNNNNNTNFLFIHQTDAR